MMTGRTAAGRVPVVVKVLYTAFVAVLVPVYLKSYGPTNFLYFCDVALLLTLAAVWLEWPLAAGMAAVGIVVPQAVWVADFAGGLCGHHLTGMTAYMFDAKYDLFTRLLSLFHGWLPFLLVYLVWRLGYDRRALAAWTLLAWVLLLVCYFLLPAPPAPPTDPNLPVNVNYVYGLSDGAVQTWMPPLAWLALLVVGLPALCFVPAHVVLCRLAPRPARKLPDTLATGRLVLPPCDVPPGQPPQDPGIRGEEVSHVQLPGTH
jgi:hypothetical protein